MIEHFSIPTTIMIILVTTLHLLFLVLEMFLWQKPFGLKTFRLKPDFAKQSAALAANQGLYNGFLAAGLMWGLFSTGGFDALVFFLSCIIIAGLYGAASVGRIILFVQAIPAMLAFIMLITLH